MSFLYKGHYLLDIKTITPTFHKDTPTKPRPVADSAVSQTGTTTSPIRRAMQGQKPPKLPPASSPAPPSPSDTVSPPPVQPKSARAIARKFELEFANKKMDTFTSRPPVVLNQQSGINKKKKTESDGSSANGTKTSGEVPPPPLPTSNRPAIDSKATSTPGEVPPPVPTSNRPAINRTLSYQLGQTSSPVMDAKKNRSCTTSMKPVALAKPVPVSPSTVATGSTPSSTKSLSTTSRPSLPGKSRSSVLLSSHSKYQNLLRERAQTAGSVKVTSGPNFSFYVS